VAEINLNPARKINLLDLNNGGSKVSVKCQLGRPVHQVRSARANSGGNVANSVVLSARSQRSVATQRRAIGHQADSPFQRSWQRTHGPAADFDACKSIVTPATEATR